MPEPARALVGLDDRLLNELGAYLPEDGVIATFPISETQARAAIASVDLERDGVLETVVAFNTPKTDGGLFLGVISREGDKMRLQSSLRLPGTYVYTNIYDRLAVPFAVRDATGDGIPEIIITSSQGASLGAQLQIFSFEGQSLQPIADVAGHYIQVLYGRTGKPAIIKTRWKDAPEEQIYEWNQSKFEAAR